MYLSKNKPEVILTWDWKDSVNFDDLKKAIDHVTSFDLGFEFIDIETGEDCYAVMVAPPGYTKEIAKLYFDNIYVFYPEED